MTPRKRRRPEPDADRRARAVAAVEAVYGLPKRTGHSPIRGDTAEKLIVNLVVAMGPDAFTTEALEKLAVNFAARAEIDRSGRLCDVHPELRTGGSWELSDEELFGGARSDHSSSVQILPSASTVAPRG